MPIGQVRDLLEFFSVAGPLGPGDAEWPATLCGKSQTPHAFDDVSAIGQSASSGNIIHALVLTQAQGRAIGVELSESTLATVIHSWSQGVGGVQPLLVFTQP